MSGIPLPLRFRELLALDSAGNRSLLFDKGMNRYSETWQLGAADNEDFLKDFSAEFGSSGDDHLRGFSRRREEALRSLGIHALRLTTQDRLVVGLGLPSATETGFLFDRLTGCPYLPGSSVKGLLRATARLIRQGTLDGDRAYWARSFERVFGPALTPETTPKTGEAIFYDAFPARWPVLVVDVLTPHYGKYYRERVIPGDWDNPVPVPFLAISAGTAFDFYIQAEVPVFDQLGKLLRLGLDWLGIGAKKSSGYGIFGETALTAPVPGLFQRSPKSNSRRPPEKTREQTSPPPPSPVIWQSIELSIVQGAVAAWKGKQMATCSRTDVEKEILAALAKHRSLRSDVEVLKISEKQYRIIRILNWRAPSR